MKTLAGGGAGAALLVYLRHPGTMLRASLLFALSLVLAWLFGGHLAQSMFAKTAGIGPVESGALVALTGKAVANGLLRAVEHFDFAKLLTGKGSDDGRVQ